MSGPFTRVLVSAAKSGAAVVLYISVDHEIKKYTGQEPVTYTSYHLPLAGFPRESLLTDQGAGDIRLITPHHGPAEDSQGCCSLKGHSASCIQSRLRQILELG